MLTIAICDHFFHTIHLFLLRFVAKETKNGSVSKQSIIDLWKVPQLLIYSLVLYFVWFANVFVYYGFSYNAGSLGGSLHVNIMGEFLISNIRSGHTHNQLSQPVQSIAECLQVFTIYHCVDRINRKPFAIALALGAAIATVGIIPFTFAGDSGIKYRVALSLVGKFFVGGVYQILYLVTSEIYPTTMRQLGVGCCSVAGRIGSTLAPFAKELSQATHVSVMMGLFAMMSLFEGTAFIFLPETRNRELPDTIEEADQQWTRKKKSPEIVQTVT